MAVITISREFGAGAKTLGKRIAEQLGYTLIDEEVVEMVALEANVSPDWVDSIADEMGSQGLVSRLLTKLGPYRKGYVGVALEKNPGYMDGKLYISLLHKVISAIAKQDNVVIIGRGAQYILGDSPDTYHFLLIAGLENRIHFMMKNYNLSTREAEVVVKKQGKRRLNLYRYFNKTDYDNPRLYHLVFNMDRVRMDEARGAVCQLVSGNAS